MSDRLQVALERTACWATYPDEVLKVGERCCITLAAEIWRLKAERDDRSRAAKTHHE